jgi:hypothetical protein
MSLLLFLKKRLFRMNSRLFLTLAAMGIRPLITAVFKGAAYGGK